MAAGERKGVLDIKAGEAATVLSDGKFDMRKAQDILREAGGHVMFIQLSYNLPPHVSPDEIERRVAITFSHMLFESNSVDSDIKSLYRSLATKVAENVTHDIVSESYRLNLLIHLTSEKSEEESKEMFMARSVAQCLRNVFEREGGTAFNL